jgi:predicted ATPase/DNA-binding NarL/FixJ family response regulator
MAAAAIGGRQALGEGGQNNLPIYLTSFVGRRAELSGLRSLLARSRMVTLIGPGGVGKSRLAAELVRASLDLWPHAVWWVGLAPVGDPGQVAGAVVSALELPGQGPAQDVALAWLASRRALIVLDSCEHLVTACAELCQVALERCPQLTLIATSRESLGIAGEAHWPVSSLRAPEAVRLFEARAALVRPDFEVAAPNLGLVTDICERIDRLPLAIELAAARMGMMTEQEILGQLTDRFQLLTGGHRTAPERQRTIIATIDWSYRLLTEGEALLFRRLSVFRGGFDLESVQAVSGEGIAGSVLDLLSGLVQKSMVVAERPEGSVSRYRLLESQLIYAEDRLRDANELEPLRRRHYEYFRDRLAEKASVPWLSQPPPTIAKRKWMIDESANLWAALEWARTNADDLGLGLAVDFESGDVTQLRRLLDDLLSHSAAGGKLRVKALRVASYLAWFQGDAAAAIRVGESAVSLARDLGDGESLARALNQLGMAHQIGEDLDAAAELFEEASIRIKGSNNRAWVTVRHSVGVLAVHRGDYRSALNILVECVAEARTHGDMWLYSAFLDSLAYAQLGLHDYDAAEASWKEVLPMVREDSDDLGMALGVQGLACVSSARHEDNRALRLAAAASRLTTTRSLGSDAWLLNQVMQAEQASRSRIGTRKSEKAWTQGWAMTTEQAIDYALGESEAEAAVDAGTLSRREQEVARLVAAGMTNREIGERLFISWRTVEGHVERIRNKLGVRSRMEVATWAVENGLTSAQSSAVPGFQRKRRTGKGGLPVDPRG